MKKFLTIALLALASFSAVAADPKVSGSLGAESAYLYRGTDLSSGNDLSTNAAFRVDNAFIDGAYVRINANSFDTDDNLHTNGTRFDGGVGYAATAGRFNYDLSVNRVANPGNYAYDFTELRATGGFAVTKGFNVYAEVGQQLGDSTNEDTYLALGAFQNDLFGVTNLKAGVQVAGYRYNNATFNDSKYLNTEVSTSYLIKNRVVVFGKYSFGGNGRFTGQDLGNVGTVGFRVLF